MTKKQYPIPTYLEWADACANSGWFTTEKAIDWAECGDWLIKELGWVIKETKEYILFAGRYEPDGVYNKAQFGNLQKIPKTWIRGRKELRGIK